MYHHTQLLPPFINNLRPLEETLSPGFFPVYLRPESTASPISSTAASSVAFMFWERKPLWGQGGVLESQSLFSDLIDHLLYWGAERNQLRQYGSAVEEMLGFLGRKL